MQTPTPIVKKHKLNTQLVRGFTLIEVIVSSVLIGITLISLATLFIAGKRHILHSRSRMTGGELGKYFLDPFQRYVRQDQWDPGPNQNCLAAGNCPTELIGTAQGLDRNYSADYTIQNNQPIANINRVRVNIRWEEPPP